MIYHFKFSQLLFDTPKPNSFSGILTNVIFFFNKAKNSSIALATVLFFNAIKERKNELKTRVVVWFGYNKRKTLLFRSVALVFLFCFLRIFGHRASSFLWMRIAKKTILKHTVLPIGS